MRLRVVYDTNVLLSGIVFRGTPERSPELARAGQVEGLTCREILAEATDRLRSRFGFTAAEAGETLADLISFLDVIPITLGWTSSRLTPPTTVSWSAPWKAALIAWSPATVAT